MPVSPPFCACKVWRKYHILVRRVTYNTAQVIFFLLLVYGLAFPHFFTAQQVTKAAVLNVRVG